MAVRTTNDSSTRFKNWKGIVRPTMPDVFFKLRGLERNDSAVRRSEASAEQLRGRGSKRNTFTYSHSADCISCCEHCEQYAEIGHGDARRMMHVRGPRKIEPGERQGIGREAIG